MTPSYDDLTEVKNEITNEFIHEGVPEKIERSFALEENHEGAAHRYFMSKRDTGGILGHGEEITDVCLRYNPVGRFEIVKDIKLKKGIVSKRELVRKARNFIYVSLNNRKIFFVKEKKFGKKELIGSDVLDVLDSVPKIARDLFLDFIEFRHFKYSQLHNVSDEEPRIILMQMNLIEAHKPASSILSDAAREITGDYYGSGDYDVRLKFYFPEFENKAFNLTEYIEVRNSIEDGIEIDPEEFDPDEISNSLEELFNGEARFMDSLYMPYYLCRYVYRGKGGETERYDVYFPVKFL